MSSTNHVLDAIMAPEGKELASPLEAAADRPKTETVRAAPRFWISKQPVEAAGALAMDLSDCEQAELLEGKPCAIGRGLNHRLRRGSDCTVATALVAIAASGQQ